MTPGQRQLRRGSSHFDPFRQILHQTLNDDELEFPDDLFSLIPEFRSLYPAPPGTIFLAFHWREAPANMLTQDFALDPVAKIPEYKICAVRIENPRAKRKAAK